MHVTTCYVLLIPLQCPVLSEPIRFVVLCSVAHLSVSVCLGGGVSLQGSISCSLRQSFLTVLSENMVNPFFF